MELRDLTYDQKKAAEAAFRGLPPDQKWSSVARAVYDGLVKAIPHAAAPLVQDLALGAGHDEAEEPVAAVNQVPALRRQRRSDVARAVAARPEQSDLEYAARDRAIQAGLLVDITAQAQELGIRLPVGMSKPLWDFGVNVSESLTEQESEKRVRDVLLALRLHLSQASTVGPISQFPALLAFATDPIPQVYALCAIVQEEAPNKHFLTLLLPTELSDQPPILPN
ncbi:MAG: hypothetical protein V3S25_07910 [Nitrospirales bacterium]